MNRRARITITAEAECDDDRFLARSIAQAVRQFTAGCPSFWDGSEPHVVTETVLVRGKTHTSLEQPVFTFIEPDTDVKVTYVARFRWWHFLLPAKLIRYGDPLKWLRK